MYQPREDSFLLEKEVKKYAKGDVLDIGAGSGIQALAAAKKRNTKKVLAVDIDKKVIEAGALLHDVGLIKTKARTRFDEAEMASPEHAVLGALLALEMGFPKEVAHCIETHEISGSISFEEAELFKLPKPVIGHSPSTWEAKIVVYADSVVFWAVENNIDLWGKDVDKEIARVSFHYTNLCYKQKAGIEIDLDHPIFKRMAKINNELIKYLKPEMLPKLDWD